MRPIASTSPVLLGLLAAAFAACSSPGTRAGGQGGASAGTTGAAGGGSMGGSDQASEGGAPGTAGRGGLPMASSACTRGAGDPVARALCGPAPQVSGLSDLYGALHLETHVDQRLVAATTHSVGLGGRLVSPLNPRVVLFSSFAPGENSFAPGEKLNIDDLVAVAFSRGEQAVELVGYDPGAGDLNFYLLVFEQSCNRSHCAPTDLFGPAVEGPWTGWTLYVDRDLEDTPFDCLSCHRPDGPVAPKRFLMRQFQNPWAHWSGFAPFSPAELCPFNDESSSVPGPFPTARIASDDLRLIERIDGEGGGEPGGYAAVPLDELSGTASGHDLSSFISIANRDLGGGLVDGGARGETMRFSSQRILCEGSVGLTETWRRYRSMMLARGFPTPYRDLDVLDPDRRAEALAGFSAYLGRRAGADSFQIGAELMSDAAEEAIGFLPSPSDDAPAILRQMCIRCHDDSTPEELKRARFNAARLDALTAAGSAAVWKRVTAPRSSPELMPPLRSGELPPWAIDRLKTFLHIP